jgi:NADH-quinone oxidoreductase subunit C
LSEEQKPGKVDKQSATKKESDSNEAKTAPAKRARPVARKSRAAKEEKPLPPSPKQSLLDNYVQMITKKIGIAAVAEATINRAGEHLPTLKIREKDWLTVVTFFKEGLHFTYMQNYSAVDYADHMQVVCHLYSFIRKQRIALQVKLDREQPKIASLTALFAAANWNEREMYDLLGITFAGHPNLTRILLPDDWEGHPLRKDYQPLDKEV